MSIEKPKVSVCIPNYNQGRFIGAAIQSVLNQTYKDFELIIVDNCSADNSEEVVKSFSDPRIRFYKNEKNIGMTRNWNRCISLAKGGYICILCADDVYLPHFLEKASSILDSNPTVGLVHSACKMIDADGKITGVFWPRNWKKDYIENGRNVLKRTALDNFASFPTVMIRRRCFEILGGFDEDLSYAPDWEMWTCIALHYAVAYIAEPLACYRSHGENLTEEFFKTGQILTENHKTIEKILSNIPLSESELAPLKGKINKIKARYTLNYALSCLIRGDMKRTRQNIALAISLDHSKIMDIHVLILFLTTFLGGKIAKSLVTFIKAAKEMIKQVD